MEPDLQNSHEIDLSAIIAHLHRLPDDNPITAITGITPRLRDIIRMRDLSNIHGIVTPQLQLTIPSALLLPPVRSRVQMPIASMATHTTECVGITPLRRVHGSRMIDLIGRRAEPAGGEVLEEDAHTGDRSGNEGVVHFD